MHLAIPVSKRSQDNLEVKDPLRRAPDNRKIFLLENNETDSLHSQRNFICPFSSAKPVPVFPELMVSPSFQCQNMRCTFDSCSLQYQALLSSYHYLSHWDFLLFLTVTVLACFCPLAWISNTASDAVSCLRLTLQPLLHVLHGPLLLKNLQWLPKGY